jgi:hypothetical protein
MPGFAPVTSRGRVAWIGDEIEAPFTTGRKSAAPRVRLASLVYLDEDGGDSAEAAITATALTESLLCCCRIGPAHFLSLVETASIVLIHPPSSSLRLILQRGSHLAYHKGVARNVAMGQNRGNQ